MTLIVTRPFGSYSRGDAIPDADAAGVLASEHRHYVVALGTPHAAKPAAPAAVKPAAPTVEQAVATGVAAAEAVLHPAPAATPAATAPATAA